MSGTKQDIVLCDLDSTLSDTRGRAHLANGSTEHEDWVEYSKACIDDPAVPGPLAAIKALAQIYPIYIVSGRNVEAYWETRRWLRDHGVYPAHIRLRAAGDISHNGEYKVAWIEQLRKNELNPILMFEDHDGVADMVEAVGVPVVRVKPGYVDTVGVRFNNLTTGNV
jgi:hypothetical protein